ncbi:MAG: hypothetical protein NVS9B15_04200 [Acidobacteriaceae bacterium]
MAKNDFWSGFGLGALAGAGIGLGAYFAASESSNSYDGHVLRIEKSVEIGAPQTEVFQAWQDVERLPGLISLVKSVRTEDRCSYWECEVDGRTFAFEAEMTQVIPDEAIGWKSVAGTKHSGRVHFAKLGNDTVVHVTMNYAPPMGRFSRLLAPATAHIESVVERALREFKTALEAGKSSNGMAQDHHFQRSAPQERNPAAGRDVVEGDGRQLAEMPGGRQRMDRGQDRIESDKVDVYSPATDAKFQGKRGPQSAGWDEVTEQDIPAQATGTFGGTGTERTSTGATASSEVAGRAGENREGSVDYTRPPGESYPSGLTEKERNERK